MNKPFLSFLFGICFLYQHASYAQSQVYRLNQLEVNSAKAVLIKNCRAYESSKETAAAKNKADQKIIGFLNDFYNKDFSIDELTRQAGLFFRHKWNFATTDLGGAVKYETQIPSEGNLRVHISFTQFQNEIVYKRIYFETVTKTKCVSPAQDIADAVDINYLDLFCLPLINFPISFRVQTGIVQCEATSYGKLKNYEATGFKLVSVDSLYVNKMVWYEEDRYQMDYVNSDILTLVNNHNTYLLYQLLYSPNRVAAIYSFEALSYLKAAGIAKHPAYIEQKMEEVQNADVKIAYQYSDVLKNDTTYKDLKISPEMIMTKYKDGLQKLQ